MANEENNIFSDMTNQQADNLISSFEGPEAIEAKLLTDIQLGYRSYTRANKESLSRVQGRLEARLRQKKSDTNVRSFEEFYKQHQRKYNMEDKQKRTGWGRLARSLSLLIAVLVMIVLIGSAAVLFSVRNHAAGVSSSVPRATVTVKRNSDPTAVPVTTNSCTLISDVGEQYVCSKGLETPFNRTYTLGASKITSLYGYADAQRLILKYTYVDSAKGSTYIDLRPTTITAQGGIEMIGGAGGSGYNVKTHQGNALLSFETSNISAATKELQLTINFVRSSEADGSQNNSGSIKLTVPFHPEKRVATLNQTMYAGGVAVTLDHVVVTPTQTTIYLKNPSIAYHSSNALFLSAGDNNSLQNQMPDNEEAWTASGGKLDTTIGWIAHFERPSFDYQGTWTVKVPPAIVGGSGTTPAVFTFTVPSPQ